jgi:hypothetical protein
LRDIKSQSRAWNVISLFHRAQPVSSPGGGLQIENDENNPMQSRAK